MTLPFRGSRGNDEAEALDAALERLRTGDHAGVDALRPGLARTIDRLYDMADDTDYRSKPLPIYRPWAERARRWAPLAACVALAFVVGFAVNALAVGSWFGAPDEPDTIPAPSGYGMAAVTPAATPTVNCTASPRTWDEMMEILATPPGVDAGAQVRTDKVTDPGLLDTLNATLAGWQQCHDQGQTLGAMAFTSERYIRRVIYGSDWMEVALSKNTLGELLNARIALDARIAAETGDGGSIPLQVDPASALISPEGTFAEANVIQVNPDTGAVENDLGIVTFIFENGQWRIYDVEFEIER